VVQLHRRIDAIHRAGAELHVIGNGSPQFIDGFRETTGWDGPLYTDPSLDVYKAAGLKRGVLKVLNARAAVAALGTLRDGFRQGRVQGDAWQQGGILVIAPSGDVVWTHINDHSGDNADPDAIVRVLEGAGREVRPR
jgi:hypothetical protein